MEFLFQNISPKQIVFKNTFWLILGQITVRFFKFLLFIFSARILGPEGWGSFQYILSIVSFFFIFSDLGISYLVVRDYNQKKEEFENLINSGSFIREFLAFFSLILALISSFIFENTIFKNTFIILSLFVFLSNLRDYITSFFKAFQKMEKEFILNFMESFLTFILGVIFLFSFKNIISLSLSYFLGILFSFLLGIYLIRKNLTYLKPKFNLVKIKYYLKNGLPLALFGMLGFVFFNTDQIMLGKFKGVEIVGYYSVATRIITTLLLLPSLFLTALLPQLSLSVHQKKRLINILKKSLIIALFLNLLLFICVFIFSPLLPFIFGEKYIQSIKPLQLLSFIILLLPLTNLFDNFLFIINKQWQDFLITLFCALLNLSLNFLLIPKFSIFGAIYSTLIVQTINLILTSLLSYYYLKKL